jgi:hypothetical protein
MKSEAEQASKKATRRRRVVIRCRQRVPATEIRSQAAKNSWAELDVRLTRSGRRLLSLFATATLTPRRALSQASQLGCDYVREA